MAIVYISVDKLPSSFGPTNRYACISAFFFHLFYFGVRVVHEIIKN